MNSEFAPSQLEELRNLATQVARRFGLSPAQSEDVAQKTLLALIESKSPVESPRAWVYTVARRQCFSTRRAERGLVGLFSEHEQKCMPSVDLRLDLHFVARRLSETSRRIVFQRALAGSSLNELSEQTGLSLSTLKRRLQHARGVFDRALHPFEKGEQAPAPYRSSNRLADVVAIAAQG